jgi:hypothetical protein
MNRFAAYFQAGYLPSLVTTYATQAGLIKALTDNADDEGRAIMQAEAERFAESGFAEAAQIWLERFIALAAEIGAPLAPPAGVGEGFIEWANKATETVRGKLNDGNVAHQPFLMSHAAGTNAGEIAAHVNICMFVSRFLMQVDHPLLEAQWAASIDELRRLRGKFAETMGYSGHPAALAAIVEPIDALVGDLIALPLRADDAAYLLLLTRFTQSAWVELVETLEFVEEDFNQQAPAMTFGAFPAMGG